MQSFRRFLFLTFCLPSLAFVGAPSAWAQEAPAAAPEAAAPAPTAEAAAPEAPAPAAAPAEEPKVDPGSTAFMLVCAALVMLMTPALGLFYGGMARQRNVLATFKKSFIALGVISIQWFVIGYSLAFAPSVGGLGIVGNLDWMFLKGVGSNNHPTYAADYPQQLHMIYQLMFAIITPALISGAIVERIKFSSYLVFIALWTTLVYDPVAHWVWGGGWIGSKLSTLDFAGGLVVHVLSGFGALCAALVIGRRRGFGEKEMPPHNLTMTALATALLWFGWFGFNAGSAGAANKVAVAAFVNTQMAAGAAVFVWSVIEWLHRGKPTVLGACTGAVAGLVAITPAAGFVDTLGSILIGALVCPICYGAILLKNKLRYDDSLDAFGVHGVGGAFGAIAIGLFAVPVLGNVKPEQIGILTGGGALGGLINQAISVVVAAAYSFILSFILLKVIDLVMGLRVTDEEEEMGLDITQHSERGYIMEVSEFVVAGTNGNGHSAHEAVKTH
jgi:Amt family ammonium transporter